jgi:hypothetical protein
MRKTNPLHLFTFGLQRTAGPYSWVNRVVLTASQPLPVCPDKQTFSVSIGMSERCHFRIHAPQQKAALFDHLVGT